MEILKLGSKGEDVKDLQRFLKLKDDGNFGPKTEEAVKKFQRENNLKPDGVVGEKTWNAMGFFSSDLSENVNQKGKLIIEKSFMDKDEYMVGPTDKEFLFLHHTAGGHDPYAVAKMWNNDTRGRIGTEFILGGQSVFNGNTQHDGVIVQAFPEGGYASHLGKNGSQYMHNHSVGIEVCNFGFIKDGKTYTGKLADPKQIVELKKPFRGFKTWHRYSDTQILVLKDLILYIAERDNIDIRKGLIEQIKLKGVDGFEYNENAFNGKVKGMWTHTNTRRDKTDMFPQQELIDMLLSL